MSKEFRRRIPGSESVPLYLPPQVPPVFENRLILETPKHFNGGFINPEFGTVIGAEDETVVCVLTHS
jgi:hypothetical protein